MRVASGDGWWSIVKSDNRQWLAIVDSSNGGRQWSMVICGSRQSSAVKGDCKQWLMVIGSSGQ